SWPVQSVVGEFRYNLVYGYGHNWIRSIGDPGARVHHNLFTSEGAGGVTDGIALLTSVGSGATDVHIYNNTFDAGGRSLGDFAGPMVRVFGSSTATNRIASLRNNLFTYSRDMLNDSPGEPLVLIGPDGSALSVDYNGVYSPDSHQTENYQVVIPGRSEGEPGFAGNDVGGVNGRLASHPFAGPRVFP